MGLFLTKLSLNTMNRAVQNDLSNCQSMHRRIMSGFESIASTSPRKDLGVLYRVNTHQSNTVMDVFIQSNMYPDWTRFPVGYLSLGFTNPLVKDITSVIENLDVNMRFVFEVVACPCKKVGTTKKEERVAGRKDNGQRIPLKGLESKIQWIKRKGEQHGFCIIDADIDPLPAVHGINNKKEATKMKHQGVCYKGVLEITQPTLFRQTMIEGIGPARAYGFGMLMLLRRVV